MKAASRLAVAGALSSCAVIGLAAAFTVGAAAQGTEDTTTTVTSTTEPTTTTPPPTTTTPAPPPREVRIPSDVTLGGIDISGMTLDAARAKVRRAFARRLVLVVSPTRKVTVSPDALQAQPNLDKAITRARFSRPGAHVPLDVSVSRERIRSYLDNLGRELDRKAVDARLVLRGITPFAKPSKPGRRLNRLLGARAIRVALKTNDRSGIRLAFATLAPKVTEKSLGPAIVILRSSNSLRLYENAKLVHTFGVATGQAAYPTPLGSFTIVVKERDPWWYPPPSPWAQNEDPVPPGPGNPLGTRWMGLSVPYVGIHGTPDAASIGYSASHGCIRMHISDAEWLFQKVKIGTPVFIVPH
ncbi:MAG TPA: L,D-transpeptidase family protein [Gaiellaceae bacterium]|nr:L,D-transpeptidase family protein [Gaiellaceae bacterium]